MMKNCLTARMKLIEQWILYSFLVMRCIVCMCVFTVLSLCDNSDCNHLKICAVQKVWEECEWIERFK